jgi:hypothetical protein
MGPDPHQPPEPGRPVPAAPSGLFPTGPPRRTYREPHPVRAGGVLAGLAGGWLWLLLFTLLGTGLASHVWWVVAAGGAAWGGSTALARYGDRGVAVGAAVATGTGWTVAAGAVALHWALTGDWPLW